MKNKVVTVIVVLLMLIPSVIAIWNYASLQNGKASSRNTVSVSLTDIDGTVFAFDRNNNKDGFMDFLFDSISNAEDIGNLPTTVEIGDFYQANFKTVVKEFGYKFYFSTSVADCYFVDGDGKAFKMTEDDAAKFLSSPYAASLYEGGSIPKMSASGKELSPDSASWYFLDLNSEKVEYDSKAVVKDELESITLEGGISMSFNIQPDSFTVVAADAADGTELFNDSYENIGALSIKDSQSVNITATAKWFEDESRSYYGEQTYKFTATVGEIARFYAGTTDIQIGEFISVTGENVSSPEKISFKSEPDIGYNPIFFKDGDMIQTLIPFNWDLSAGNYVLTFEYGGTSQQINISLSNRSNPFNPSATVTISDAIVNSYGSDDVRTKCENELKEVLKASTAADKKYFDGEFLMGVDNSTIVGGFGHTFTVSGKNISYRHTGIDYRTTGEVDVQAINNGVVVYAGYLDYSGYTVIVEHGYGLKSLYAHMSKVNVNVNDTVKKGDCVGTTGSSGFIAGNGAHIGLSVFDVPVCQYALWNDGSRKCIPMYQKN